VGGMTLGTLLTLFVVPSVYTIMGRKHAEETPNTMVPQPAE
jgi:multidrug efflux pump